MTRGDYVHVWTSLARCTNKTFHAESGDSVADQCPQCQAKACGFRKINEDDFEGFCFKCGATWPEPGKATVASDTSREPSAT